MNWLEEYNPEYHHRRSIRLPDYDYSKEGIYFITICTHQRELLFGNIENGVMNLNALGVLARDEWLKTPQIRTNVELGEFIIMPDHLHGIIMITSTPDTDGTNRGVGAYRVGAYRVGAYRVGAYSNTPQQDTPQQNTPQQDTPQRNGVGAYSNTPQRNGVGAYSNTPQQPQQDTPQQDTPQQPQQRTPFRSPSQTVGAIVRGYKSSVTKKINLFRNTPGCLVWQRNYYEHIIRGQAEFLRISDYIRTNPVKWQDKTGFQ